jgi:hypothetical protein
MNEKCEFSIRWKITLFLFALIQLGLWIYMLINLEPGVSYIGLIYF